MTEVVIEAEGLTRRLAGEVAVTLVEDAGLVVRSGEFVAITGASGSGKSSLLYLLGLLDRPTSGRLWLMPTSPPQVRLPITGPRPASRK